MANSAKNKWVSASDVGRASYCPHYLELKNRGTKPSEKSVAARAKGEINHEALNRQAEDRRCFIATHLYGIDDQKTDLLRSYRDQKLALHFPGKLFIQIYYALSPSLISLSRQTPALDRLLRYVVDRIVLSIRDTIDSD